MSTTTRPQQKGKSAEKNTPQINQEGNNSVQQQQQQIDMDSTNVSNDNNDHQHSSLLGHPAPFPVEDPNYIYPLSSFPPLSFWERRLTVPALIVPARRTAELRNRLKHVLRYPAPGAAKSKHNSPVQLLLDDDVEIITTATTIPIPTDNNINNNNNADVNDETSKPATTTILDRSKYRKLILRSIPRSQSATSTSSPPSSTTEITTTTGDQQHDETHNNATDNGDAADNHEDVMDDVVYQDPTIQSLLSPESNDDDDDTATTLRCYKSRHVLTRSYPHDYTVEEILQLLLRQRSTTTITTAGTNELPGSSFEVVGTIAHVNLRDEFLPFRYWIGKVLYDKHQPRIQTVVTKIGTIDTVYRTFSMQVISPITTTTTTTTTNDNDDQEEQNWSIVMVNEEGCQFQLDYQKVYWNSRLSGEHKRLVNLIFQDNLRHYQQQQQQQGDKEKDKTPLVVVDLMAGVGPFAIPLTTTNRTSHTKTSPPIMVHANDLNPSCYHYLQINARLNKCREQNLHLYNMDGRRLVHQLQDNDDHKTNVDHFIMNLPAMAPECCSAFRGYKLLQDDDSGSSTRKRKMPLIHVYCFAPKESPTTSSTTTTTSTEKATATQNTTLANDNKKSFPYQGAVDRCSHALQCPLDWERDEVTVHVVRDVSPNKNMVCVSFRLPMAVQDLPRAVIVDDDDNVDTAVVDEQQQDEQQQQQQQLDATNNSKTTCSNDGVNNAPSGEEDTNCNATGETTTPEMNNDSSSNAKRRKLTPAEEMHHPSSSFN